MRLVLDSGPLGLLSNPTQRHPAVAAWEWANSRLDAGDVFSVPEIADYEVRRELIRAGQTRGVQRLDLLCEGFNYLPLTTEIMRIAAELWATARNAGTPTASDAALDADVILAAQAMVLRNEHVVVATTNTKHLERFVEVQLWGAT